MTTDVGPHLLGRRVEHDPASRNYRAPMRRTTKPQNITHAIRAPILDQGNLGSCVGNTAAAWLNTGMAWRNRKRGNLVTRDGSSRKFLDEEDAVALYSQATLVDEDETNTYPPDDNGTSALGVAKALKAAGFIDAYDWTFSFPAFLAALQLSPCCVGINWYSGMYDTDSQGYVYSTGSLDGGHEILAYGVNFTRQWVLFRNHWSAEWGLKGSFKMTFNTIEKLLSEQGDVMVPRLLGA